MSEELSLYDRNFAGWLERRLRRPSARTVGSSGVVPQRYVRLGLNQLLRGSLDRREIARLDALNFAR